MLIPISVPFNSHLYFFMFKIFPSDDILKDHKHLLDMNNDISQKLRLAIKSKLTTLDAYIDDEVGFQYSFLIGPPIRSNKSILKTMISYQILFSSCWQEKSQMMKWSKNWIHF